MPMQPGAPWLWALLGAGATASIGAAAWLLLRRRPKAETEQEAPAPVPGPVLTPEPAVARVPVAVAAAAPRSAPFELELRPLRMHFEPGHVAIDLELLIGNAMPIAAEGIRMAMVFVSANPAQDAQIASFAAAPQLTGDATPFDLPAGSGGTLPITLTLPREHLHVVDLGGRPMFVPLLMIDLRWRSGLSIRRHSAAFLAGTSGQGGKLGPIWLDRPAPSVPLAANRYFPRSQAAAA